MENRIQASGEHEKSEKKKEHDKWLVRFNHAYYFEGLKGAILSILHDIV